MSEIISVLTSGDQTIDLLIAVLAISTVGALSALRAAWRKPSAPKLPDPNQGYPVGGKLERLDQTVSEFRSETLRGQQILQRDVDGIKASVEAIRSALQIESGSVPVPPAVDVEREPEAATLVESPVAPVTEGSPETASSAGPEAAPRSLGERLRATRRGLFDKLRAVFSSRPTLNPEMLEELRALLVSADLGPKTVEALIAEVRQELEKGAEISQGALVAALKRRLEELLSAGGNQKSGIVAERKSNGPLVVLVVGVNGVGKTTTVAKLAQQWKQQGARVLMVAADTFRAAAVQQLSEWASRIGVPVVTGPDNAKPATVVFEGMQRSQREEFDVVVIDTAGRLQNKANLMQELEGIRNAIERHQPGAPHETLLVVDGSTGQNAISQAREFNEVAKLSGLVVTKLDGTPKGGVVVGIKSEFGIPVRYIGVGEAAEDLRVFQASEFVEALFEGPEDSSEASVIPFSSAHGEQRRRRRASGV